MTAFSFVKIMILAALFVIQIDAYCIYNKVKDVGDQKTEYWMRQQSYNAGPNYFSRFSKDSLKSGEKVCCPYSSPDCVKSGNKDDELYIVVRRTTGQLEFPSEIISLPAGGWVELGGGPNFESQTVSVFKSDGSPYDYELRMDSQAGYTS